MNNRIIDVISKIWDAQVMPKRDCKSFQEQIDRVEDRRSGRVVRAIAASAIAVPMIGWPVVSTLTSSFRSTTVAGDNIMNQGMTSVPQVYSRANSGFNDEDILMTWGKGLSLISGLGFLGFALKRANDAKLDGQKIAELKLDKESRDHFKGVSPK